MHKVFCSSIILEKKESSIVNIIQYYWCIWWKKSSKNGYKWRGKSASSPIQCTMSQVDCNNGKITWIAFQIASAPTLFFRSYPQQLLALCRPQKVLQGKRFGSNEEVISETEAYFETKDKSVYKKGIELLENHWNQFITLEGDCWWIKSNFA